MLAPGPPVSHDDAGSSDRRPPCSLRHPEVCRHAATNAVSGRESCAGTPGYLPLKLCGTRDPGAPSVPTPAGRWAWATVRGRPPSCCWPASPADRKLPPPLPPLPSPSLQRCHQQRHAQSFTRWRVGTRRSSPCPVCPRASSARGCIRHHSRLSQARGLCCGCSGCSSGKESLLPAGFREPRSPPAAGFETPG